MLSNYRHQEVHSSFYGNTQSWQCWHVLYCLNSKMRMIEKSVTLLYFKVLQQMQICFKLNQFSLLIFYEWKLYKNGNVTNFVYYGKTRLSFCHN